MAFLDKALGKAVSKVVSGAVSAAKSAVKKSSPRVSPKVTPRPKTVAPSTPRPSVTPSTPPIVRTTTPTRTPSPFVQSAVPVPRPSLIVPPSRTVRSVDTQAAMQAERIAAQNAATAARAAAAPKPFGVPKRLDTPTVPRSQYLPDERADDLLRDGIVSRADDVIPPRVPPRGPAGPATPATPGGPVAGAVDETAPAARRSFPLRGALELGGALAPAAVQQVEAQGQEVPGFLKGAASVAQILAGGSLARRGMGSSSLLSAASRNALKSAPLRTKLGAAVTKGILPAVGVGTVVGGFKGLTTGAPSTPANAVEEPVVTEVDAGLPSIGGISEGELLPGETPGLSPEQELRKELDDSFRRLEDGIGTKQDADNLATGEKSILDKSVADAMAALEAAYGGPQGVDAALTAGDPILLQQLAGIDADYKAGLLQIQANYAGALGQVAGYQAQADALLKDVAAAQMAGFEAAAGGLEAMSPGVGLTGSQAAAAGVSDTALGGAGITGAALSRGLAGAASVQAAADRLRLGTDLSGQLATGRLTQADLEAGLSRAAAGEKAAARTESAQREAEARALAKQQKREDAIRIAELKYQAALDKQAEATRKEENEAARKQRIAELKFNAEQDLAMKVAAMTPEERAAYKNSTAGKKNFKTPPWYGKSDPRDPGTSVKVPGTSTGTVTVGEIQNALDYLDSLLQDPKATDPSTAFTYWAQQYANLNPDALAILRAKKRPVSASAMYKSLFGSAAPKK